MLRMLVFIAIESLAFTVVLWSSWQLLTRAFARVGVLVRSMGLGATLLLSGSLLVANLLLTCWLGPQFTLLYRMSGMALLGAVGLFMLCWMLGRYKAVAERN